MSLATLVTSLAGRLGLPPLEPDADGHFHLAVDGETALTFEPLDGDGGFVLLGRIGPVPATDREAHLARMLSINLTDRGWTGSFLALDADYGEVVLCRRCEGDVAPLAFEAELERFVERIDRVRERLAAPVAAERPPEAAFQADALTFRA